MKSVFVIWKDIEDGMWYPVAKLTRDKGIYRFNYTQGSKHPNFISFPKMKDKTKVYVSNELFSFFQNRLLPQNRPEFRKMINWSGMTTDGYDELDMLSISGGARQTDEYRVIALPECSGVDEYKIRFFISGIRYLESFNLHRISDLIPGEKLLFEFEEDNEFDCNAVYATTSDSERVKIGYCPKYFNCDIRELLNNPALEEYKLTVVQVNNDAPPPYRLLCDFSTKWPENFVPLISNEYLAHTYQEELIAI